MPSTDIAPEFYRSNRGSFPATRTTDIPGREQSRGTRKLKCRQPTRPPQAVNVVPFEFRSGVRKTSWRFWIEYDFGACLSRIDTKRDRLAKEKTFCQRVLFQLLSLLTEHCNDCASAISLVQFLNRMCRLASWRRSDPLPLLPPGFVPGARERVGWQHTIGGKAPSPSGYYTNYPLEIAAASVRLPNP